MAETKRMTADELVSYLLEEDGVDFLRESLKWVVGQLMEAEVSELTDGFALRGRPEGGTEVYMQFTLGTEVAADPPVDRRL